MKPLQLLAMSISLLIAQPGLATDTASCKTEGYGPEQYQVFIDAPTGYAFIKTPCGWHFVRQIEAARIAESIQLAGAIQPSAEAATARPLRP